MVKAPNYEYSRISLGISHSFFPVMLDSELPSFWFLAIHAVWSIVTHMSCMPQCILRAGQIVGKEFCSQTSGAQPSTQLQVSALVSISCWMKFLGWHLRWWSIWLQGKASSGTLYTILRVLAWDILWIPGNFSSASYIMAPSITISWSFLRAMCLALSGEWMEVVCGEKVEGMGEGEGVGTGLGI